MSNASSGCPHAVASRRIMSSSMEGFRFVSCAIVLFLSLCFYQQFPGANEGRSSSQRVQAALHEQLHHRRRDSVAKLPDLLASIAQHDVLVREGHGRLDFVRL